MAKRKRNRAAKRDAIATPAKAAGSKFDLRLWGVLAAFIAVALLAYSPALLGGFVWDDDAHVTKPELQSLSGLYRIWFDLGATQQYYPLLHSAFWLEHKLWGDAVLGYHLVNVLQHSLAAWLAYLVLRKLNIPGALLAAAIFLLHPVHVESAAWITEQKNTLSAVFYLGSMLAYLNFDDSRDKRHYALALLLFVLGLLAKTVVATLPAVLLVIFWWQRGRLSWRRDVVPLIPWFALGAAIGLFVAWVERTVIGAEGARFELSFIDRGLLAGRVIWFYLAKLLWPTNLMFVYPRWHVDAAVWWQWLFPAAALATTACLWAFRAKWRAPLAGWLIFVGTLFPVLGFLNLYLFMYSFVADHFQYLASLALIALAAAGLTLIAARLPSPNRIAGQALGFVLLAILGIMTWQQSRMYSDSENLYRVTLERNPECWMVHNNLGVALVNRGMTQEAYDHYQAALQLRPDYPEVHVNMGVALARDGRLPEAIEHYRTALDLRPNYAEAHDNLGIALFSAGNTADAIRQYEQALKFKELPTAHNNLGIALLSSGKLPQARTEFQAAIKLQPSFPDAYNNLGSTFAHEGRMREAISQFEAAVQLNPAHVGARMNLAAALLQTKEPARALEQLQKALDSGANKDQVFFAMAMAHAQMNQADAADAMAQKALDAARAQDDNAAIEQIEAWTKTHRAGLPASDSAPTKDEPAWKKNSPTSRGRFK